MTLERINRDYRIASHKGKILLVDCIGQSFGEFPTIASARAYGKRLILAELDAKRSLQRMTFTDRDAL